MEKIMMINISMEELNQLIQNAVTAGIEATKPKELKARTYSFSAAAKKMGRCKTTIDKLVETSILKTTKDGRISEIEIDNYIKTNS